MLHGVRVNPRRRRRYRRSRGLRGNPFSMPTLGSVTGVLKTGGQVAVGWIGVNAVLAVADKVGLAKVKASQSAPVAALINAAVRIIATPVVAKLASRFLRMDASKVAAGGAINVVLHGIQDVVAAKPGLVPAQVQPLLLGYDGFGDFVTVNSRTGGRMAGFVTRGNFAGGGMGGMGGGLVRERASF